MRYWALGGAIMLAVAGTTPAAAQSDFESEVLRRLERLEQRVSDLERGRGGERREERRSPRWNSAPPREDVVAAVNILCGASFAIMAQNHCRTSGYANGVALKIEKRGAFDYVTQARCYN